MPSHHTIMPLSALPHVFAIQRIGAHITIIFLLTTFVYVHFHILLFFCIIGLIVYRLMYERRPGNIDLSHQNHTALNLSQTQNDVPLVQMVWVRSILKQSKAAGRQAQRQRALEMLLPPKSYESSHKAATSSSSDCVICLNDFVDGDSCRVFPMCKHIFHVICIDNWLEKHLTCPICRHSLTDV
ncbi:putative RING-H2 finger protein ATL19 [Fagus crenata]|jgi:hypothetical protein